MKSVGIICEYNPFHNGHLYHIQKVRELFPKETLILVVSGNVTQRGELSILSKWEKTEIALHYGIDLVVELPYVFASQSADIFAKGALQILNDLQVSYLVFGSEIGLIEPFLTCAKTQLSSSHYQEKLEEYLKSGLNYPSSLSKALKEESGIEILHPNDLLGLSYVREILQNHYSITPITYPRTNDYHSPSLTGKMSSATSIRNQLKQKKSISDTVPEMVLPMLTHPIFLSDFFPYLRYKILSEENLSKYETVDERVANRLKEKIITSSSLEEFLENVKTKYYTYNRLMRMCSHILFSFTKKENDFYQKRNYIRVLGFNEQGKKTLNSIKKELTLPLLTNYSNDKENLLFLELRCAKILSIVKGKEFLQTEIQNSPIQRKKDS